VAERPAPSPAPSSLGLGLSAELREEVHDALVATLLELCAIPSEIGHERAICDHVEARLRRAHPRGRIWRVGHSLIARPAAPRPGVPTVGLVGHLDTVPARQMVPVHFDGERVWGAGASDMKAGLAVMLELSERLDLAALPVDLLLVFYEREEGPYLESGLEPLLAQHGDLLRGMDLGICLEPSDNRVQLGAVGSLHATLTFSGRRAHSARPWEGVNAVHAAGPLLAELGRQAPREVTFGGAGTGAPALTFREVMSVTMVHATGARNVVPEVLKLNLNYRFAPGRSVAEAQADVEALVERVGAGCAIEWTDLSPSGTVPVGNPLLEPLLEAPEIVVEAKQAWTDVARLGLHGIDAINWGPGESAQAHQRDESCRAERLIQGYEALGGLLRAAPVPTRR